MYRLRAVLLLLIVYLMLTSNLHLNNVLVGLLLAAGIVLLLRVESRPMDVRRGPAAVWALVLFVLETAVDLVVSGFQVARMVLSRDMGIKPGIVAVPSGMESDLGRSLSADAITLTPGELVVETDSENGDMYTHSLDVTRAAQVIADQERRSKRLRKVFP